MKVSPDSIGNRKISLPVVKINSLKHSFYVVKRNFHHDIITKSMYNNILN